MSTSAQIAANQENAKLSSGPKTEAGKATSALNHFRHGLSGSFTVLAWEKQGEYNLLEAQLLVEHQPATRTEELLVEKMAQSSWLRGRALTLQNMCFNTELPLCDQQKDLALYLRYQTTHDRAFSKALDELQTLRATKRKEQIGFDSQQRKQAEDAAAILRREAQEKRRQAAENRAQELHQARVRLTEAQAQRHETEIVIAKSLKMPRSTNESGEPMAKKAA